MPRSEQIVRRRKRNEPLDGAGKSGVESHKGIRLELGQRHIFGVEGVFPAQLIRHVPRSALQDPVAEEPDPEAPQVVQPAFGIAPGQLPALGRLVEQREHVRAKQGGGHQLVRVRYPGVVPGEPQGHIRSNHVSGHRSEIVGQKLEPDDHQAQHYFGEHDEGFVAEWQVEPPDREVADDEECHDKDDGCPLQCHGR